jgi:hypothetical protein
MQYVQNFKYDVTISSVGYAGNLVLWIQKSKMPSMGLADKESVKNFGWGNLFENGHLRGQ